ncbi:MAG TPA: sensor histidine kinase [Thermoanaerobacterales bacterium]|nr:sensor histidine kinase [Thermoanaerobacterales bacterium]
MNKARMDIEYLDEVINSTIDAIEKGQKEIFNIFEHSKQECERIEKELEELKVRVKATIDRVDNLVRLEKSAKFKLMMVSRDFEKHSEEDIKAAYEEAKDIQIRLSLERQIEIQLREKRDDLERNLKSMLSILNQSEHLMMQLGVALGFLKGNLEDVSGHISDISERRNLAAQIIKAQEEERRRVARDIHDGPAQTLANIVIQTEICERLLERDLNEAKKELKELKNIVRLSLQELRNIIFNLRPSSLDDLGLRAVTKRYCEEFQEETGIKTDFRIFGDKTRLNSDIEVTLFRVIQEALTNVRKHSKAKSCVVKLEFGNGMVNLVVIDDGVGFEIYAKDGKCTEEHFGIMTIKERVALVDGSFNIESEPGQGTKIFTSIPFTHRSERRI